MEISYVNQKKFTFTSSKSRKDIIQIDGPDFWNNSISSLECDSSGVYTCKSMVNYLRHEKYIYKSEENVPVIRTSYCVSSEVNICN